MNHPDFERRIFATILDGCVTRLHLGESAEECLAAYPQDAQELAPLLNLAAEIIQLPPIEATAEAVQRGRSDMLAALAASRLAESKKSRWKPPPTISLTRIFNRFQSRWTTASIRVVMVVFVALFLSAILVATTSAASLPGEPLYPLKRSIENTRLMLTFDNQAREAFESQLEAKRRHEVQTMVDLGRSGEAEFEGHLEAFSEKAWKIDGLKIEIGSETVVIGELAPGQKAQIVAHIQENGNLKALIVEVRGSDGSGVFGTPVESPAPASTEPVYPTGTVPPTGQPEPSPTLRATEERDRTLTPRPTELSQDRTPTPRPTDRPPAPTNTPRPTQLARDHTPTPQPTDRLPDPTSTPPPSDRPHEPTDSPHPTDRPQDPAPTPPPSDPPPDPASTPQPSDPPIEGTRVPLPTEPTDQSTTPRPSDRPHDPIDTQDDRT